MRYISIFSGIEAASVAFAPLGWEPVAFSEIDPFPSAVLGYRYPDIPNLGDITKVDWKKYKGKADLVVGGSPCQSFSIAGKREGLEGESGLMFEFIRCVREVRPRWFLWENVPGALSSEGGAAFGQLLHEMADGGYGLAWRVLDAQFFGVAQRRRRLFLVGRAGDGFREACQVLFEPDCVPGNSATSRAKRAELAAEAGRGAKSAGFGNPAAGSGSIGYQLEQSHGGEQHGIYRLASGQANAEEGEVVGTTFFARQYKDPPITVVTRCGCDGGGKGALTSNDVSLTLSTRNEQSLFVPQGNQRYVVRRLTPVECERLQGFPDGWTQVPYHGKPALECPDSPRYKAIGNSMAVPVMRWIGKRIEEDR